MDIDGYRYKRDVLFCYDLKLPESFIPRNEGKPLNCLAFIQWLFVRYYYICVHFYWINKSHSTFCTLLNCVCIHCFLEREHYPLDDILNMW